MDGMSQKKFNQLRNEKSPYLLQHANNPVNWHPWGKEAFEQAKKEKKPIFLSIGYSTCHWCHVMAHESFEDDEVAKILNDHFISIKVDREERPDIDKIYMDICQIMTGAGGWPLTIIMDSEKIPFFAGTYIPKSNAFQRMGMLQLLPRIIELWNNKQYELQNTADEILLNLKLQSREKKEQNLDKNLLKVTYEQLLNRYDEENGGFSVAPKFPTPHNLFFLLRYWKRYQVVKSLEMVEKTLQKMRMGGIYDHLGFGFARYSTDATWLVPHYEKMLYDQALIALAYLETYQITKKKEYRQTAREIFEYVIRDMTSSLGGFYSAEDADSEGEEGKFYLWSLNELEKFLTKDELEFIINVYNLKESGNFVEQMTGKPNGTNILHLKKSLKNLSEENKLEMQDFFERLDSIRIKIFNEREKRIHPSKDDKILTDWNGLMIVALARGSIILQDAKFSEIAERAMKFLLENMINKDGRLLHRYRDGEASIHAFIDDYAFLIWGLLELYEATFNPKYLKLAYKHNEDFLSHFWDEKSGGFFFSADDSEELLVRSKEIYDGAIPSGNSVAMLNLLKLGTIKGDLDLIKKANTLLKSFSNNITSIPSAHTFLMSSMDYQIGPYYLIVIAGNSKSNDTFSMLNSLKERFLPNVVLIFNPSDKDMIELFQISEVIKNQVSINDMATAYVCFDYSCKDPLTNIDDLLTLIREK